MDLRLRPLGNELASLLSLISVEPRLLLPPGPPSVAVLRIGALGGSGGFTEPLRPMFPEMLVSFESLPNSLRIVEVEYVQIVI